jgi:subtilisin-like proprotein convertase family protein
VNRKHSRLALVGMLTLALSVTAGIAAGGAAQATGEKAAKAKKKKRGNKARTFQNGQQLLIPDDPEGASFPGVLDATIKVGNAMRGKHVRDVDVSVRITHPVTADLRMFLIAPNGATVGLADSNPGQPGNTGYGSPAPGCSAGMTTFNDETFNFLSPDGTEVNEPGEILSPWAANVEPQGFPGPLNIVDGGRARGTWILRILDNFNGDIGTLNCFKLRIKPGT